MADFAADSASHDITGLLLAWRAGDRAALEALIPLVYEELRQIAHRQLAGERHQTLQTIDLVHEAYVRLVDAARPRGAQKRGGDQSRVELEPDLVAALAPGIDVIALDEALSELAAADPRRGQVVELRYFGGLSLEETARALGVSTPTVSRHWEFARVWLHRELSKGDA